MTTKVTQSIADAQWTSKRKQPSVDQHYKGTGTPDTYVMQQGNTLWDVAKSGLESKGMKVTNEEIMKELNRLTIVNDCKTINEMAQKFKLVGSKVRLSAGDKIPEHPGGKAKPKEHPYEPHVPNPFAPENVKIDKENVKPVVEQPCRYT